MPTYRLVGAIQDITSTGNDFSNARLVRICNKVADSAFNITVTDSSDVTLGTMTIRQNSELEIEKDYTDKIKTSDSPNTGELTGSAIAFL